MNNQAKMLQCFGEDMGLPVESYKYDQKKLTVTYYCVEATASEVNRWSWTVPAFVITKHYQLITQKQLEARIDENERWKGIARDSWYPNVQIGIFDSRIEDLKAKQEIK